MNIIIIGNGIAGITAARHIRKNSKASITVISGESPYFFSRTALMYVYMGHMKFEHIKPYEDWFWKKNDIKIVHDWVQKIDRQQKKIVLTNEDLNYDKLIIATGSKPNMFDWPGNHLQGIQGLYHLQDLESMTKQTAHIKKAVVVGGGLIGIEMVEMLHTRHIPVTFLVRESSFWNQVLPPEESAMLNDHILAHGIDLRLSSSLKSIQDNGQGGVSSIETTSGEVISCEFVGITVGVSPQIKLAEEAGILCDKGILVDDYLQTNDLDVYAVGDCAQVRNPLPHRKSIEAVWYVGRKMGETVAQNILGKNIKYDPGIWFNSAKFFDNEYQTYGYVPSSIAQDTTLASLYWEDRKNSRAVRIVFDKDGEQVVGFNAMGIRLRHETCDQWIKNKSKLDVVIRDLKQADFNPEFSSDFVGKVKQAYQDKFPTREIPEKKHKFSFNLFSR